MLKLDLSSEFRTTFRVSKTGLSPSFYRPSQGGSFVADLLCLSVCFFFGVGLLIVCSSSLLGNAVLCDCGISWVSKLVFLITEAFLMGLCSTCFQIVLFKPREHGLLDVCGCCVSRIMITNVSSAECCRIAFPVLCLWQLSFVDVCYVGDVCCKPIPVVIALLVVIEPVERNKGTPNGTKHKIRPAVFNYKIPHKTINTKIKGYSQETGIYVGFKPGDF